MNTELYNKMVAADDICKQAAAHFGKAEELEAQCQQARNVKKDGYIFAGIGIGIAVFFIFNSFGSAIASYREANMLGALVAALSGIASYGTLFKKAKEKKTAETQPLLDQAAQERAAAQQVFENNYEAVSIIPEDYWYPLATEYMVGVVKAGRANSVPEALAMYDEQLHRWKMENAQAEILAQQQIQTAQLASIKRSSAVSAGANVATAISSIARHF